MNPRFTIRMLRRASMVAAVAAAMFVAGGCDLNVANPNAPDVNRAFAKGRLTVPKTEASIRAVPLQARALAALDRLPPAGPGDLLFPAERGGYLDLHNFRSRHAPLPGPVLTGS